MLFFRMLVFAVCFSLPAGVFAAGGHDTLACTGCHAIHTAKDAIIFAVPANKSDVNPRTKQPFAGVTALCLGCHESPEKGGMGIKPIEAHMSHPYGLTSVNEKVARVPQELLRDGRFECVGCHDPHPSNANYKYLRIDTANGSKMDSFCAVCHPMKADPKVAVQKAVVFSSMDERMYNASGAATTDGQAAPKANKK